MDSSYLAEKFSTTYPILNAPMAGAAGGRLAAAVSLAGGLGMVGFGADASPEWIDRELAIAEESGRPWGVGLMAWTLEDNPDPLHRALRHHPALVSVSFGDPRWALDAVKEAGSVSAMQVGSQTDLGQALEYDADIIVVRGAEGGGHGRNDVGTLPLLQLAVQTTSKPVLAAGGIATANGVAAVLAAGAAGAWIGTRFTTVQESMMPGAAKDAIERATMDDTVYTRSFDIAQKLKWPPQYGGRAVSNAFAQEWADRADELQKRLSSSTEITERMRQARKSGDTAMAPVYAGQAAGLTPSGETAADVVTELAGYRRLLAEAAAAWS
ncbi:NAD(P)H-dependent flavin oxidoreductase [Arthrobacter monumenti]